MPIFFRFASSTSFWFSNFSMSFGSFASFRSKWRSRMCFEMYAFFSPLGVFFDRFCIWHNSRLISHWKSLSWLLMAYDPGDVIPIIAEAHRIWRVFIAFPLWVFDNSVFLKSSIEKILGIYLYIKYIFSQSLMHDFAYFKRTW